MNQKASDKDLLLLLLLLLLLFTPGVLLGPEIAGGYHNAPHNNNKLQLIAAGVEQICL